MKTLTIVAASIVASMLVLTTVSLCRRSSAGLATG